MKKTTLIILGVAASLVASSAAANVYVRLDKSCSDSTFGLFLKSGTITVDGKTVALHKGSAGLSYADKAHTKVTLDSVVLANSKTVIRTVKDPTTVDGASRSVTTFRLYCEKKTSPDGKHVGLGKVKIVATPY